MGKAKELADVKYPIVPLSLPETTPSGEILNSDKALDDFRISIQSFCSNHTFIEGYEQALKDIKEELDKRLESLWNKLPDASNVIKDNVSQEQMYNLGKYNALESFESFVETLV